MKNWIAAGALALGLALPWQQASAQELVKPIRLEAGGQPFVELIRAAGIKQFRKRRKYLRIRRPVSVEGGGKRITIVPAEKFYLTCDVFFPHPLKNPTLTAATAALGNSMGVFIVEAVGPAADTMLPSPKLPRAGGVLAPA